MVYCSTITRQNDKKALALIKNNVLSIEEDDISLQQTVQLSVQTHNGHKLSEKYQQFLALTDYNKRPIWTYFELLRYGRVNNEWVNNDLLPPISPAQ